MGQVSPGGLDLDLDLRAIPVHTQILKQGQQQTPESAEVLGDNNAGWFGKVGVSDLMAVANAPYKSSHKFEDMYICDPAAKYYGFKSWDGMCFPFPFAP